MTIENDTTGNDVIERDDDYSDALDDQGGDAAFEKNLTGAAKATGDPKEGEETDADTEASDTPIADDAAADSTAKTTTDDAAVAPTGDDAIVEVRVGEETHKVPVRDLKRLFGQEAALTRRSQEVSTARTEALGHAEHAKTVLTKALERAEAKFEPYAKIDFWEMNRKLDPESFAQLRKDAQEAHEEVTFLRGEGERNAQTIAASTQALQAERATSCVKALTDKSNPSYVEGWTPALYGELLAFANDQGFTAAQNITDPAAIKLLRMAMLYARGKTLAQTKVTKVAQQTRAPLRAGSTSSETSGSRSAADSTARLRRTGRADDAEAAFMSRLRGADD